MRLVSMAEILDLGRMMDSMCDLAEGVTYKTVVQWEAVGRMSEAGLTPEVFSNPHSWTVDQMALVMELLTSGHITIKHKMDSAGEQDGSSTPSEDPANLAPSIPAKEKDGS